MYTSAILATLLPLLATSAPTNHLQTRQTTSSDDILNGDCGTVNYIFARGTTEVGNLGTVIGPGFGRALGQRMGDVAVQGVDYPANVAGFLAGGSNDGADTMAELARQSISQCPGVPIVMSGYSAQVVSKAMDQLTADEASNVGAVVLFGNPNGNDPVPNTNAADVEVFCNVGDLICAGTATILPAHLTYGSDADEAADFVAGRIQV
ncbi:putative cutinase 3 [Cyphellophora attinorum]|uniref:cutinase n=1 Tax=Cyphellophora attinorum TaxID=1664694 RepID=A0A0N0NP59_9EURO|nr:putative cutinase 3 [Phialophora attinorum]KPI42381.1 putative cutinase 3 [Phialophora attinorum]